MRRATKAMMARMRTCVHGVTWTAHVMLFVSLLCAALALYTAWRPAEFDLSYSENRWTTVTCSNGGIAFAYAASSGPPDVSPLTGSPERAVSWAVFNGHASAFKKLLQSYQWARESEARRSGRAPDSDMEFVRRQRAYVVAAFESEIADRAIAGVFVHGSIAPVTECVVRLPLTALAAAFAIYPAKLLVRQHRRLARARNGQCVYCGYSLYGIGAGRCPECGCPATTWAPMPLSGEKS